MKNRTIATSIFTASLGLTLLAGSPAANAATENGNPCPAGSIYHEFQTGETRTVVTNPAHTIQREISPAVPAVTKVEFEYAHAKNDKLEPRWEAEGWNAESNPNSAGWIATGQTRIIIITSAIDAVYELIHVPETTIEVPILGFTCLTTEEPIEEEAPTEENPAEEVPTAGDTTAGGNTDSGNGANTGGGTGGTVEVTLADSAPPALHTSTAGENAALPLVTGVPETETITVAAQTTATDELANTGAESTAALLTIGALALGGGTVLLGAARLRTGRVTR